MDNERLKVDQPETDQSHWNCEESNYVSRPRVTEYGQHSGGQNGKIGHRFNSSQGHASNLGIFAPEHGRTIAVASDVIPAEMFHRQITTVRQANDGHQNG